MAKYKSVFDVGSKQTSVMEALGRISSELAPKVVSASIEQSPIAANRPESYDPVAEQYASLQDYINAGGIPLLLVTLLKVVQPIYLTGQHRQVLT